MNIEKRLADLEAVEENRNAAIVRVSLDDGRQGLMLWPDAVHAAINGKVVDVDDSGDMAALIRALMRGEGDEK